MKTRYLSLLPVLLIAFQGLFSQTATQNYVVSKTMTNSTGTTHRALIQYYDGLGRPNETVLKGFTPLGFDLVSRQDYDAFGRESKTWLPSPSVNKTGAYNGASTAAAQYADTYPYSETLYEASPLNRTDRQYGPGKTWRDNSRAVKTEYLTNSATYPCGYYYVSGNNLIRSGNYAAGALYVTKLTDEDNNLSYEFRDKLDRVVLQRQISAGVNHDTYYVYDDFGNLRFVLPPLAADATTGGTYLETTPAIGNYAYLYRYDSRNRCSEKKLPGAGWNHYVYDKADRLILSQDGVQRVTNKWSFTKYDALGRPILSGEKIIASTRVPLETLYKDKLIVEAPGTTVYKYTNTSALTLTTAEVLNANYYDNYTWNTLTALAHTVPSLHNAHYTSAKGLLTGTMTKTLGSPAKELYTTLYYDYKGNLVGKHSQNTMSGTDREYLHYTFTNEVEKKLLEHRNSSTMLLLSEQYTYLYDHAGRIKTTTYRLGNELPFTLAAYTYNEKNRLLTKQIGGKENTSYGFNLRGWLEKQSGPRFTQEYFYTTNPRADGGKYFGGNISALRWQEPGYPRLRGYFFQYDQLSRMKGAVYGESFGLTDSGNNYTEMIGYDKHGNVTQAIRSGRFDDLKTFGVMDVITVTKWDGNRPVGINDSSGDQYASDVMGFRAPYSASDKYTYDANGNMTFDFNKKITKIQYNVLNLPNRIDFTSGNRIETLHDASGVKRRTKHYTAAGGTTLTREYIGNKVYENGLLKLVQTEEGYVAKEGTVFKHYFYLKDHLGNNRVVINGSNNSVAQVSSYYPFGATTADLPRKTDQEKQPYKYNGKELDRMYGLDWYDYGARMYDPIASRFWSPDPMAEKYYSVSPYAYCKNNPVNRIDPDGMDDYTINQGGYITLLKKKKDETDRLIALGEAGKVQYDKKGNMTNSSLTVGDKKMLPGLSSVNKDESSNIVTANKSDAFNVFTFAADNSNVEWSLSGFKSDGKSNFLLNTEHNSAQADNGIGSFFEAKDMTFNVHSHPDKDGTKGGSGYFVNPDGKLHHYQSGGDGSLAGNLYRQLGDKMPNLYVYHRYSQNLYQYSPWKSAARTWNIKSGRQMGKIVFP